MLKMPLNDIIARIKEKANVSEEDINSKIEQKLKQLSGLISKEGAAHIVANEYGVKLFEQLAGRLEIKNILAGMRNVEAVGRVQQIFDVREFHTESRQGKVGSFVIADETGSIRVVCWGSQADLVAQLSQNQIVKVVSGYVRENSGRKEVHLNERSKLILNPAGEKVGEIKQLGSAERKGIKELKENDENIELLATIVQVFDPRFFEVCPECGKRTKQSESGFICDTHQKITPSYSYVLNLVLDDGTENIRAVFFKNQANNLLNKTEQGILGYKDNPAEFEAVKTELLGNIIKVVGRATKNQFFDRLEFIASRVYPSPDPDEEISRLSKEVGELEKPALKTEEIE